MPIEILILSHLLTRSAHGYELKRKVSTTTAFELHNNSLYPALRRFEESGAVTKTAQQQEGRPPRHVYEITDLGRELLHDLLADLPPGKAGDDDEFLARVGLFELLEPDERRAVVAARRVALLARTGHLDEQARRAVASDQVHEWGSFVVAELLDRLHREQAWLDRITERIGDAG